MRCLESDFTVVSITVGPDSLVEDVLKSAAVEWGIDSDDCDLIFADEKLPATDRLVSHAIGPDAELCVIKKKFRLYGKKWFSDELKMKNVLNYRNNDEFLFVDSSTFAEDASLYFEDGDSLPRELKKISFRNSDTLATTVGASFLDYCEFIKEIEFPAFNSITTIEENFLFSCSELTKIDLSGLCNVTSVGNSFLSSCKAMEEIDLSPFVNIQTIGNSFIYAWDSIKTIDLSSLSNVTTIGNGFLSCCDSLETVNLSGLSKVTSIGSTFLYGCASLRKLDLSSFTNVTEVGSEFLTFCRSVSNINLSGFGNVTTIKNDFLAGCVSLKELDLSCLSNVTAVECKFMLFVTVDSLVLPEDNKHLFERNPRDELPPPWMKLCQRM